MLANFSEIRPREASKGRGEFSCAWDNVGMNGSMLVPNPRRLALVATLSFQILVSCAPGQVYAGQCCQAELIDSGKLLQPNLPGSPAGVMTLTLEYAPLQ